MSLEPARAEKRVEFTEQCVTTWKGNDITTSKPYIFIFSFYDCLLFSDVSLIWLFVREHQPPRLVSSIVTEKRRIGVKMKRDERDREAGRVLAHAAESL